MKLFNKFIFLLNIGLVIATILAYLAPYINPKYIWFLSVFGSAFPILVILHIMFVIFWIFNDFKKITLSVIILLIGFFHIGNFIAFNSSESEELASPVSIISYNISNASFAYDSNRENKEKKEAPLVDFLKRFNDEDIVCFQEVGGYATDVFNKSLRHSYKYHIEKGTVIYSKHPIINKGLIEFGTQTNACIWADITIGLDTVRVYNAHLQSNKITTDTERILEEQITNNDRQWNNIKGIFSKYKTTHLIRADQAQLVKNHMNKCPYPVILCGDLNDTPLTFTYHTLSDGLNDAFYCSGQGIGTTFNGRIPLLRIDYILHSSFFKSLDFNVVRESYSDHYPIAAILEF